MTSTRCAVPPAGFTAPARRCWRCCWRAPCRRRPAPRVCRPARSPPRTPSAPRRARSAASSRRRTTAARRSTTRCPRSSSSATSSPSTGSASYLLQSDINDFNAYRYQFDDMIRTGDIDPAYRDLRPLPAAQPRAHAACARAAEHRAGLDVERDRIEFDREHAPWPATQADDRRAVAQARQERRAVADADRQDLAGGGRHAAQALRAGAQARRSGHRPRTCSRT